MTTTLIVPGLKSSSVDHWQSWFERRIEGSVRVIQSNWRDPHLPDWASRVRRAIHRAPGRIFIVAHSFGCLAAAQAAWDMRELVSGAMLVAPADPETFGVADLLPNGPLGFPSVVVASDNDPWMVTWRARAWAETWGSSFINVGRAGHINPASGYGPWPDGLAIFDSLRRTATEIPDFLTREDEFAHVREISWT